MKKTYNTPEIEQVILDNEISLALESVVPPVGPGDEQVQSAPFNGADPYKQHA